MKVAQYKTERLELMRERINKEINNLAMQVDKSEDFRRIAKLREARITIDRELSLREFSAILSA